MPKIYISDKSDLEYNESPFEAIFDVSFPINDELNRLEFKKELNEFLRKHFKLGSLVEIFFDDECYKCGLKLKIKKNNKFEKCICIKTK